MPHKEPFATKLIQQGLIASGFPLPQFGADGSWGDESQRAFDAYVAAQGNGLAIGVPAHDPLVTPTNRSNFPTDDIAELKRFYGAPDMARKRPPEGVRSMELPYRMQLAWDSHEWVSKVSAHEKVHESLFQALDNIRQAFGPDGIRTFRLDQFGGLCNVRFMRGSTNKISRHAFGIAIDLDPEHNGLRTPWPLRATMPIEAIQCFEAAGWTSFARVRGIDAMHFQATSNYIGN
jgi:hypothetical protein